MPIGQDGVNDMLWPQPWNLTQYTLDCVREWAPLQPRPDWVPLNFWGKELQGASNIIFSNGDLDPWSGGGVTWNVSESVTAIIIEGGAHHLDLRAANPSDPPSVLWARQYEKDMIRKWISN